MPHNSRFTAWAAVLGALLAATSVQAQTQIAPGTRVRVHAPGLLSGPVAGRLSAWRRDSVIVVPWRGVAVTLPLAAVRGIEVSQGGDGGWWKGGLVGFGLGSATAVLLLSAFCSQGDSSCSTGDWVGVIAVLGLPPAFVGGVIGAIVSRERWAPAGVPVAAGSSYRLGLRVRMPLSVRLP